MALGLSLLLVACAFTATHATFTINNCSPAGSSLQLDKIEVSPNPLVVPGDFHLVLQGSVTAPVASSSITLSVKRKTFLLNVPLPCVANVGSCTYPDTCTFVDQFGSDSSSVIGNVTSQITSYLSGSGIDLKACPQPIQDVNLDMTLHLPALPALLTLVAEGEYLIHAEVTDNVSHQTVLCLDIDVTIDEPCSGLGCIFGK